MNKEVSFAVGVLFINAILTGSALGVSIALQNVFVSLGIVTCISAVSVALNIKKYNKIKNVNSFSFVRIMLIDTLSNVLMNFSVVLTIVDSRFWVVMLILILISGYTNIKTNKKIPNDYQKLHQICETAKFQIPKPAKIKDYYENDIEQLAIVQYGSEELSSLILNDKLMNITENNYPLPKSKKWNIDDIQFTFDFAVCCEKNYILDNCTHISPRILISVPDSTVYFYCKKSL